MRNHEQALQTNARCARKLFQAIYNCSQATCNRSSMNHFYNQPSNFRRLNSFETVLAFTYWRRGAQLQIVACNKAPSLYSQIIFVFQIYHCWDKIKGYGVGGTCSRHVRDEEYTGTQQEWKDWGAEKPAESVR